MPSYSRHQPSNAEFANALRALADMMDRDRAHLSELSMTYESSAGARIRTIVDMQIVAYEDFRDPREHPGIAAQPRLTRIGGGPALGPGLRPALTDGGE